MSRKMTVETAKVRKKEHKKESAFTGKLDRKNVLKAFAAFRPCCSLADRKSLQSPADVQSMWAFGQVRSSAVFVLKGNKICNRRR